MVEAAAPAAVAVSWALVDTVITVLLCFWSSYINANDDAYMLCHVSNLQPAKFCLAARDTESVSLRGYHRARAGSA